MKLVKLLLMLCISLLLLSCNKADDKNSKNINKESKKISIKMAAAFPSSLIILGETGIKLTEKINDIVNNTLNIDDNRFKMDDVKKDEILRQIKAQINFDPYKTNLSKDVIYEIYNKYFDNNIFNKLNAIDNDSKEYIASGNFNYIPNQDKVDYDITTYNNLSNLDTIAPLKN